MPEFRKETLELIDESIYYCLINPIEAYGLVVFNQGKKLDLSESSTYCYNEMLRMAEDTYGYSRAIRFDGKKKILSKLQERIVVLFEQEKIIDYLEIVSH